MWDAIGVSEEEMYIKHAIVAVQMGESPFNDTIVALAEVQEKIAGIIERYEG